MEYKPLDMVKFKDGAKYTQLFRKGRIAIYQVKALYIPTKKKQPTPHYEVIIIRQVSENKFLNEPAKEMYPSTWDWGVKGWTYFNYERATMKVGELMMQGKFV